jgi:hypothetical protein
VDTKKVFVERIAETYLQKYAAVGYEIAQAYLKRLVNGNTELEQQVVDAVEANIKAKLEELR